MTESRPSSSLGEGLVNTLEARAIIQNDPDRLGGCGKRNFVTIKDSWEVLLFRDRLSPRSGAGWGQRGRGAALWERPQGVAGSKLNVSTWCALAVMKVNTTMDILGLGTGAQPVDGRKWLFPFSQHLLDNIWSITSIFGVSRLRLFSHLQMTFNATFNVFGWIYKCFVLSMISMALCAYV